MRRIRLAGMIVGMTLCALGSEMASASASSSAQGPPSLPTGAPFAQCPAVAEDPSCGYLIDITNAAQPTVISDPTIGSHEREDDVLVGVQNDSSGPVGSIHVGVTGSGYESFGFDGDGLCNPGGGPVPGECPFGPSLLDPYDYWGPDAELTPDPSSIDDGTVTFPQPLQPGQYTYFSLETPSPAATVVAGALNDVLETSLSDPTRSGRHLADATPVNVTDSARLRGAEAGKAPVGKKVIYHLYSDASCTQEILVAGKPAGGEQAIAVEGILPASDPVGATLATNATYYWQASYEGDTKNNAVAGNCGDETVTFGTPPAKPQATIATTLTASDGASGPQLTVSPGTPVSDGAAVTSGGLPQSGRVSYYVFSDPGCKMQVAGVKLGSPVSAGGSFSASPAVSLALGTYYFQAIYSGNPSVAAGRSACGAEVLNVTPPCACARIKTYLSRFRVFGVGSTRLQMRLNLAIDCTTGPGPGCQGEVVVRAPRGAKFIDTVRHPKGVKAFRPTEVLKFTCAGPCAARTIQRVALTWLALKRTRHRRGKRTVTTTGPIASFLPHGRANKSQVLTVETLCFGASGAAIRPVVKARLRLTIHYDRFGQVEYRKSDLNGDGRRDKRQLTDLTGF